VDQWTEGAPSLDEAEARIDAYQGIAGASSGCLGQLPLETAKTPNATVTYEDIRHLCGELADWKAARILASEATYRDLKAAMTWAVGQGDVIGPAERPLAGRAVLLYEIITADEDIWGENERP